MSAVGCILHQALVALISLICLSSTVIATPTAAVAAGTVAVAAESSQESFCIFHLFPLPTTGKRRWEVLLKVCRTSSRGLPALSHCQSPRQGFSGRNKVGPKRGVYEGGLRSQVHRSVRAGFLRRTSFLLPASRAAPRRRKVGRD